ncbi:class I adenylate-forming enzyme family protein [Actinokineospora sp. UTMC 2448]|uniref:class I adenylate-forming enzyme family protein n=1 Tax=Actinokineospora sp. UTMC 2448 TaxID=2268449 RepID=UPI002164CED6|nr:class I adenylate-forming enzyme family protein [Actinokineospora sp. UTMC 2448]UVS78745.1 Long-chain-fatty-acid--CoA ligase [Actinokineospora sp. UTMC 2448]
MTTTNAPSIASGPPLATVAGLCSGPRIDDPLRRAAERVPDRPALRTTARDLTFGDLDARATRVGAALAALLGEPGVVAMAMVLDPAFALAFYGIARSGHVSALVNPLLRPDGLVHVLATSGARAAIVPPEVYDRLCAVRDRLPELRDLILTAPDDAHPGVRSLESLERHGEHLPPVSLDADPDAVACLQFTSGTTGAPKAVRLTHRNLTVNAAQTVHGHQLTDESVLFNYLPTFHLMHLSIGVAAMASHVLFPEEDTPAAATAARRFHATHLYSLPVRLARMAADPRLVRERVPTLRAIMSGGSALRPDHAETLARHFGVPVVQGFGLAETSPCTHLGDLDRPKAGSSGVLVPGAECRIVDIDTGAVVPIGETGELQVKGPQLMAGYVGRDLDADLEPGGWFATGDIAFLDEDGYLFVVDRIKDVFKRDNWLVAPGRIEAVLQRHPDVADCVVFDHPDEFCGAVAHALVVPVGGSLDPAAVAEFVNGQVPYFERVEHIDVVTAIPRSPTGKVSRRDLRRTVADRRGGIPIA